MQRNAGLLCDGLTPANQTGDAKTSNKTSVAGITASLGRYLQAAVGAVMSEGTLNENRPSHFFFFFLHPRELQLHQCTLDISQFHTSYFIFFWCWEMLKG